MTLGEKISSLRKERGFTQAELGNELGVTYQAVSKWERDDSMPDFDMISKLAKLFGVPIAHFENNDGLDEQDNADGIEEKTDASEQVTTTVSQSLGVCTVCGKYIDKDNVGWEYPKLVCKNCRDEQIDKEKRAIAANKQAEKSKKRELAARFNKRAIIAAVVAGLIALTVFIVQLVNISAWSKDFDVSVGEYAGISIASFIMLFTWIFQLFFDGAVRSVTLAGMFFIRLPGIIFTADLDGLIFLVVMKVLFFIISAVVFLAAIVVTSIAAAFVSLVTFIPVVIKIIRRNEDIL